jgi:hypothetical protein
MLVVNMAIYFNDQFGSRTVEICDSEGPYIIKIYENRTLSHKLPTATPPITEFIPEQLFRLCLTLTKLSGVFYGDFKMLW